MSCNFKWKFARFNKKQSSNKTNNSNKKLFPMTYISLTEKPIEGPYSTQTSHVLYRSDVESGYIDIPIYYVVAVYLYIDCTYI